MTAYSWKLSQGERMVFPISSSDYGKLWTKLDLLLFIRKYFIIKRNKFLTVFLNFSHLSSTSEIRSTASDVRQRIQRSLETWRIPSNFPFHFHLSVCLENIVHFENNLLIRHSNTYFFVFVSRTYRLQKKAWYSEYCSIEGYSLDRAFFSTRIRQEWQSRLIDSSLEIGLLDLMYLVIVSDYHSLSKVFWTFPLWDEYQWKNLWLRLMLFY